MTQVLSMSSSLNSTLKPKTPSKQYVNDRFITSTNTDIATYKLTNNENIDQSNTENSFGSKLASSLFSGDELNSRILSCKLKAPKPTEGHQNELNVLYTQNKLVNKKARTLRHIPSTAERILDAPDMQNDFYLNLLDWGTNNSVAVGLGSAVYVWDAATGAIDLLCEAPEGENITSLKWTADGGYLAIANSANEVQLWDSVQKKHTRTMKGHEGRVAAMAWNNHILSTGSKDNTIIHHDVRIKNHVVNTLRGHTSEVCSLAWSVDGTQLASGANDNVCCIWDAAASSPRFQLTEARAAVKGLAWAPFQKNLLATGAGTADMKLRFYNTSTGSMVNEVHTGSQVTSIQWSRTEKELITSHGFSQNQLTLWKYPTMVKVTELTGHTARVLHTALSPDGTTVCSAGADETLRFWRVWEAPTAAKKKVPSEEASKKSKMTMMLR